MSGRGLIRLPEGWGFMDIISDSVQVKLVLTPKAMKSVEKGRRHADTGVSIEIGHGPVNFIEKQFVFQGDLCGFR